MYASRGRGLRSMPLEIQPAHLGLNLRYALPVVSHKYSLTFYRNLSVMLKSE